MRRMIALLLCTMTYVASGCAPLNRYDSDPVYRTKQLLNESEDLRQAREEKHRFWLNNQPSTLSYDRLSGAIGP